MRCPAENTIAAFADGSLPPDAMARVEAHAATCIHCQQLLGVAVGTGVIGTSGAQPDLEQPGGALARGATIGRYTILSLVGQGGMGEVYAAYDPELDRKVALKLLRSDGTRDAATGHARLLREAKAMARVSHPNVVAVHDAGTFGARVFLTMEFVEGPTMRAWLAERPRTRGEVLAVFVQAAQGLMAAHAAGLVHRDFKPGNVMIASDGNARVTDFGIARSFGETRDEGDGDRDLLMTAADARQTLTATGQLLGTPRYMAPEQFRAAATDARTDQFSFCVALYEALYGVSPFSEGNVAALAAAVLAGRVQPAPPKSSVPEWQRRVLLRGLSLSPEARWPSMRELVAALMHDPSRARRRWALAAGATLLVALSVIFLARHPERSASFCRGGPARLVGAWEPLGPVGGAHPRRDAIERAFLSSGPGSNEVWKRVAASLDRYTTEWLAMYEDACVATHVRGEQTASVLDLRMSCLDERRTALMALTNVFAGADRGVVAKSIDAVDALPGFERCADVKGLESLTEPPRDEATRVLVADLRRRIATAKALHDAGKAKEAVQLRTRLVEEARASGYRPVLAEALSLSGRYDGVAEGMEVMLVLEEAIWTAIEVGHDDLAAMTAIARMTAPYYFEPDLSSAPFWIQLSRSLLDRAGPGQERLRSWFAHNQAVLKLRENDFPAVLTLVRQATALKQQILPKGHQDIARSQYVEALALHALGKTEDALLINQRAHDTLVAAYGPSSALLPTLSNSAEYLLDLGRPAEALVAAREGLSLGQEHLGLANRQLAYPLTGMGRAHIALGHAKEAIAPLEQALRLRDSSHIDPGLVAETQFALAQALADAGTDVSRAFSLATKARDGYRRAANKTRADVVEAWLTAHPESRRAR